MALVGELRVELIEHLFERNHLVDDHAEDCADGALAREAPVSCESHLPAQQINQVFAVTLVQHCEVALDSGHLREFS